jgi:hypothetical protein
MASSSPANGAKPEAKIPRYNVVRVKRSGSSKAGDPLTPGDTLTIVKAGAEAKQPMLAVDAVVDALPAAQRVGEFGAFGARGFVSDEYTTETKIITTRGAKAVSEAPAPDPTPVSQ